MTSKVGRRRGGISERYVDGRDIRQQKDGE